MSFRSLYHYQQEGLMTQAVLDLVADPSAVGLTELRLASNVRLSDEASAALVGSPLAETITKLRLDEVYVSAEQFAELLRMPQLTELEITGGSSADWSGPTYLYPTLDESHVQVLLTDPNARRLRTLSLVNQRLGGYAEQLRATLPHLEELDLDGCGNGY